MGLLIVDGNGIFCYNRNEKAEMRGIFVLCAHYGSNVLAEVKLKSPNFEDVFQLCRGMVFRSAI